MIEFAPFGSNGNRRSRSLEIVTLSHDEVPRPSPKSIYRLADKVCIWSSRSRVPGILKMFHSPQYDIPALKILALNQIRELGEHNVAEESFSRFASRWVG